MNRLCYLVVEVSYLVVEVSHHVVARVLYHNILCFFACIFRVICYFSLFSKFIRWLDFDLK